MVLVTAKKVVIMLNILSFRVSGSGCAGIIKAHLCLKSTNAFENLL